MNALARLATGPLALIVGVLPVHYWNRFPELPLREWAFPSGLLTTVAGAWVFLRGWVAYAHGASAGNAVLFVLGAGNEPEGLIIESLGILTLLAFSLASPVGWFANYLIMSGFVRAMSAFVGQPLGDPALTVISGLVRRQRERRRAVSARQARAREEGPEVADRLIAGDACGLPDTDVVVVSSRHKPEWSAGLIVVTPEGWYRLSEPFDLELPHGLRTAYPLTPIPATEVLRRWVSCTLPPLQTPPAGLRRR